MLLKNKYLNNRIISLTFFGVMLFSLLAVAQTLTRQKIDSLRWGFDYGSAEAYKRANQAKHLDSTYYVGYLIEGYHFAERAEDLSGLAKAIPPLEKALALFEKDYGDLLNKRIDGYAIITGSWRDLLRQLDYYDISNRLINTYITIEKPQAAYQAARRLLSKDLVFDFQSYHWMSWLYFRSRIYTSADYPFLKNSISDNMAAAIAYSDSMEMRYKKNVGFIKNEIMSVFIPNTPFYNAFQSSFVQGPLSTLANTRGIIYGYNLQPELAAKFFKQMPGEDNLAKYVNLGYTYLTALDFREAERYFRDVPDQGSRSRGGHWQGYSVVHVSKNAAQSGAAHLQADRDSHGYTIGYGWDNLCLARMYLYAGQLQMSESALSKAENFQEVHYNTSFREDQYRFMLKTLQLLLAEHKIKALQFENKNKWFSMKWWRHLPENYYNKYTLIYRLANELADNPERDIVFYRPFHSEAIISFDELWYIISHFSTDYFADLFQKYKDDDPRQYTGRYYQFYLGLLSLNKGNNQKAYDQLTEILSDQHLDQQYEKLLIARIHQIAGEIADKNGWRTQTVFHTQMLYQNFAQLLPFSDLQMKFLLKVSPEVQQSAIWQELSAAMQNYNIEWNAPENENWPTVEILSLQDQTLTYQVEFNREVFTSGAIDFSLPNATKRFVYALFRIQI